jgi:hypothetical protein
LLKYILKSPQPILKRIKPARLLVTVTTNLGWLWTLTVIYKTVITAVDL